MVALSTVIPGNMVKSRRAIKASCLTEPPPTRSPTHAGLESAAAFSSPSEISASVLQPPLPNRNPNFQIVRNELGKLTGSLLNNSDEQSSNDGEEEDSQPATSVLSSMSPDPARTSAQLQASACLSVTAAGCATDLKDTLSTSASAADAVLAFQRWRISSLKAVFTQELKNVLKEAQQDEARLLALEEEMERKEKHLVHALADSAQLRAQLCALDNVNGQHQGSSEVEILLGRALERATSSEAEVERYNKEIRKLRERLKSMEDEASRLDSELKANVSFLQKDKDGIAKENQVLLEQLARKDDEVLSQTKEIGNLKSVLACLRISPLKLERLKSVLQGNAVQPMKTAKASDVEVYGKVKEESLQSSSVCSQVLDLLQTLTACLQKNEAYLDFSEAKPSSEEKCDVQPNLPQNGAADCKPTLCPGQSPSSRQFVTVGHNKGFQPFLTSESSKKISKVFIVTCWKWRWVAAASEVQALHKKLTALELSSKVSFQQLSSFSCLENLRSQDVHPSVNLQAPITLEKVLCLLTSIWNVSSQSAQQEKETFFKNRQIEHLVEVMTRWMQKTLKKRQLERVIVHWLRFLLQSWKNKFKHQNVLLGMAPTPNPKLHVSKPTAPHLDQSCQHLVDNAVHIKRSTNKIKARNSENCTRFMKKEPQKPKKDVGTFREEDMETFQEWLHNRLEALEALILKESKFWHQEHLGDKLCAHKSSAPTNLVWRVCCEMEHCFVEARNQMLKFFGVWNKSSSSSVDAESGAMKSTVAGPSKLLSFKIGSNIVKC